MNDGQVITKTINTINLIVLDWMNEWSWASYSIQSSDHNAANDRHFRKETVIYMKKKYT